MQDTKRFRLDDEAVDDVGPNTGGIFMRDYETIAAQFFMVIGRLKSEIIFKHEEFEEQEVLAAFDKIREKGHLVSLLISAEHSMRREILREHRLSAIDCELALGRYAREIQGWRRNLSNGGAFKTGLGIFLNGGLSMNDCVHVLIFFENHKIFYVTSLEVCGSNLHHNQNSRTGVSGPNRLFQAMTVGAWRKNFFAFLMRFWREQISNIRWCLKTRSCTIESIVGNKFDSSMKLLWIKGLMDILLANLGAENRH